MSNEKLPNFYNLSIEECAARLQSNLEKGLSTETAKALLVKYGPNELKEAPKASVWALIAEQFKDHLVQILLGAACVSFALAFWDAHQESAPLSMGTFVEPITILVILVANAVVGIMQEQNAEKAIDALKSYTPEFSKVVRDGCSACKVPSAEVVPGDVLEVCAGDRISADCRVVRILSSAFKVDQAVLTGESAAVTKHTQAMPEEAANALLQDRKNSVFSGTVCTTGRAFLLVCRTGMSTEIGRVHESIAESSAGKSDSSEASPSRSPLKIKLDEFGDWLAKIIVVVCVAVWAVSIRHFGDAEHGSWLRGCLFYFKVAVALAVAAIPEGLAVVITTAFALGSKRMAKRNAFVRTLSAVETLGCTTVICSDKTGTLTSNKMVASRFVFVSGDASDDASAGGPAGRKSATASSPDLTAVVIEGSDYNPFGVVTDVSGGLIDTPCLLSPIEEASYICSLCNASGVMLHRDYEKLAFASNTSAVSAARNGATSPSASQSSSSSAETDGSQNLFVPVGDPTEAALKTLAERFESTDDALNKKLKRLNISARLNAVNSFIKDELYEVLHTLDFDRDRKSMSVLVRSKKHQNTFKLLTKGAPENILDRSSHYLTSAGQCRPLDEGLRQKILAQVVEFGQEKAFRVLALAERHVETPPAAIQEALPERFSALEAGLTFVGLVGIHDPPRREVASSVQQCAAAGIRVIVVTGDNQHTAVSVCTQVGIIDAGDCIEDVAVSGSAFHRMSPSQKLSAVGRAKLFFRVEPAHKKEIVQLLQTLSPKNVVAMTGDGVNDAPALQAAHIGVAMGSGTDVAKLAADIVLADDNFATIVYAVEEGRSIYNNMRQFIRYLISSNIGEVVCVFAGALLGLPEVLSPVQLLWVNLVTDGLPATALSFNPPDRDVMRQRPRDPQAPIVDRFLLARYVAVGTYVGVATVAAYLWQLNASSFPSSPPSLQALFGWGGAVPFVASSAARQKSSSTALSVLVVIELFNALNGLSETSSLVCFPPWRNPFLLLSIAASLILHLCILHVPSLASLMGVLPLSGAQWRVVIALSFPIVVIDEIFKWVARRSLHKRPSKLADASKTADINTISRAASIKHKTE